MPRGKQFNQGTSSWPAVSVETKTGTSWATLIKSLNVVCEAFELFNCCFYFVHVHMWGGCKSRQFTVYHMCKTWLQKVHGRWETGGDFK